MNGSESQESVRVFDSHIHVGFCGGHIGKRKEDFFISVEEVIDYLDQNKIQKALIFPFPNRKSTDEMNEYVVKEVKRYKSRLKGMLYFSWKENPEDFLKFTDGNIVGIGEVHPSFSQRNINELPESLLEIVREKNWVLLVDSSITEIGHPGHIVEFAKRNPDITIICAHMARLFHQEILEIAKVENVYLDLSAMCLLSVNTHRLASFEKRHEGLREEILPRKILEYLLFYVGKEKLIWGSDFPFPLLFGNRLKEEIKFATDEILSFLSEDVATYILNKNLERLLGVKN